MNNFIRWAAYPVIFGATALFQIAITTMQWQRWPLSLLIAACGIVLVALLERFLPYHRQWNRNHRDFIPDIFHALFSLTLIFASLEIGTVLQQYIPVAGVWPSYAPIFVQVLLAGLIIDFGLWLMHCLSHKYDALWRLHALHHSSTRLYWLNGERRHPLSAILLASPGMLAALCLGAAAEVIACWFAIIAVHLAFQHANLDYSVGPLRKILCVAEVHRWHHKREFESAQVNFGEFWAVWDQMFGTYLDSRAARIDATDVGIEASMPTSYFPQLVWPFRSNRG